MPWLILIAVVFMAGAGMKLFYAGESSGRAQCKADIEAADRKLQAKADELEQETKNHIDDMVVAFDAGESQIKTRVVTIRAKGTSDVQKFPVFSNPVCVLPADSLRSLNAARAGFRTQQDAAPTTGAPKAASTSSTPIPLGKRP
jgi:predicted Ser/Thr protein kinase